MRRKLFKASQGRRAAAVAALLLGGSAAHAQTAVPAQMWAATARYVYADDPNLKPIVAKLNTELGQPQTLDEFGQRLQTTVDEAAGKSKSPNVRVLQRQFQKLRTLGAADLVTVLPDSLSRMPVRNKGERQQKLNELKKELARLAQGAGDTPTPPLAAEAAATPGTTATSSDATAAPYTQTGPTTAPATSPWTWVALAMSGLSLLGVVRLLTRRRSRHGSSGGSESGRSSQAFADTRELTFEQREEVKRMIERALAAQQNNSPLPSPLPSTSGKVPAAKAPVAKAPTANVPRPKAAPASAPEPAEVPSIPLPALDSMIAESLVAATPLVEPDATAVEPGMSIELDVAPSGPTPQWRRQYVNEAPFNNTFAARTLSDTLAPYSIYEIQYSDQTPDQGEFRVVGNLVSHISNHRNILEPVCEYIAYPQSGDTRIVTEQPGEVRRRGDDWEVMQRARIRFE